METDQTSDTQQDRSRRRWEWLLLLLALPISFGCVFCSSQLALSSWPNWLVPASLLPQRQADYTGDPPGLYFAALDPAIAIQAATDSARLHITPTGNGDGSTGIITFLPATPTATFTISPTRRSDSPPSQPNTATPVNPVVPSKTPTSAAPTPAPAPTNTTQPTSTSVPTLAPTSTVLLPTNTPVPTGTPVPLVPTSTPEPLPTSPPPPSDDDDDNNGGGSTPTNIPPVAANDSATTAEDTGVVIAVLVNDSDTDGTLVPGSVTITGGPTNGAAVVDPATGAVTYTPNQDFNGFDTFTYQVCDNGGACNTANVNVQVTFVNDPPVAVDDTSTSAEDTIENIFALDNDTDVDGQALTIVAVSPAANGSSITDGSIITYTPNMNFNGTEVLIYTISDGSATSSATVTVTVYAINDPPEAFPDAYTTTAGAMLTVSTALGVLSNDADVDAGDSLTAVKVTDPITGSLTLNSDGSFTYIPNIGFVGVDSFSYQAADKLMSPSNVVTVTITVS